MKTKPSHYVLAAEILTIIFLHAAKIRKTEKYPEVTAYTPIIKAMILHKPGIENKTGMAYMPMNLIK
jgi:hypothetical protein